MMITPRTVLDVAGFRKLLLPVAGARLGVQLIGLAARLVVGTLFGQLEADVVFDIIERRQARGVDLHELDYLQTGSRSRQLPY